jgi:hypothetical protein
MTKTSQDNNVMNVNESQLYLFFKAFL